MDSARVIKGLIFVIFLLFPFFYSHGEEHIVLYRFGTRDPGVWDQLRKHLGGKGYKVSMYEGADNLEKHIENVNRINRLRASLLLAMDFSVGAKNQYLVAVTTAKRGTGNILAIDEVPSLYGNLSRELAGLLAGAYGGTVKEFPLFPLLGVDMPGVYLNIECTPDQTGQVLDKLSSSLQKYFRKGKNDEG